MMTPRIIDYLKAPERGTLIEAELHPSRRSWFEAEYKDLTGENVPRDTSTPPYYVWSRETNKWGLELRMYFISDRLAPPSLIEMSVKNNRPGYTKYDKRINNNDFIMALFRNGFVLGTQK